MYKMSEKFPKLTNNYIEFLYGKKEEVGPPGMIPWADKKKRLIDEAKELLGPYKSESHRQEHFEQYARFVLTQMTPASIKVWKDTPAFGDFLCYITENHRYVRRSLNIDSAHGSVCHPIRSSLFNTRRRSRARSARKKPRRKSRSKSRSRRSTKRSVKRSKRRSRRTVKRSAKRSANRRKQSRKRSRKRR